MALTASTMLPLGTPAPNFSLPDVVSGREFRLDRVPPAPATVLMFICNHCPYVQHILPGVLQLAREYRQRGVEFVAISSNDAGAYPDDAPDQMRAVATQLRFPFPYLYDESQTVARAYDAACTPDFYVFDAARNCVYRGRFDESTPGNGRPVDGADLRAALDALLDGRMPAPDQHPSMGCSIKWKKPPLG